MISKQQVCSAVLAMSLALSIHGLAAEKPVKKPAKPAVPTVEVTYPPTLPDGKTLVTDTSDEFLKPAATLSADVHVAKTPPTVDFMYFPGQTYPGKPWSAWGDSLAANGKYYASIGDHLAPSGNAFVFEYDPAKKTMRQLADVKKILNLPDEDYTPGKIHGRLDMGSDGWLYFSTHRGSPKATTDAYHYKGDWILRCNPATEKAEIVVQGPVPKHCIPNSVLDPERLIFYGGTAAGSGSDDEGIQFFAYDVKNHKLLYSGTNGPARYMIFAKSTGRVYYMQGAGITGDLMRYDPAKGGAPEKIEGKLGIRAATQETADGMVYTVSTGQKEGSTLYSFNTKTEQIKELGPAAIGGETYVASMDTDAAGRYVYYVPGAHGGASRDGSPIVQYDTKTNQRKVLAFLHPFYNDKYGATLKGTYSSALDPDGSKLYVTWNVSRGSKAWDSAALAVIHIPESERQP